MGNPCNDPVSMQGHPQREGPGRRPRWLRSAKIRQHNFTGWRTHRPTPHPPSPRPHAQSHSPWRMQAASILSFTSIIIIIIIINQYNYISFFFFLGWDWLILKGKQTAVRCDSRLPGWTPLALRSGWLTAVWRASWLQIPSFQGRQFSMTTYNKA